MKCHSSRFPFALLLLGLPALLLPGCRTPQAERLATPWIQTKQRLTLLSANDGQAHLKLDPAHIMSNIPMKLDRNFTRDSITVVHLGPDHPPVVKTVYATVPNTINLVSCATRKLRHGPSTCGAVCSRGRPDKTSS